MKTFTIGEFRVEQYDERNPWCIRKVTRPLNRRGGPVATSSPQRRVKPRLDPKDPLKARERADDIIGYYPKLSWAREHLADIVSSRVKDFEELDRWITKLKEVYE